MKLISKLTLFCILFCLTYSGLAQTVNIYPVHWWTGMKYRNIQLLFYASDANFNRQNITTDYSGVSVGKKYTFENGKYLALDIRISPQAKPGTVKFKLSNSNEVLSWELKSRRAGNGTHFAQGVTSRDFIYLLMPDRFSNGDPSNDRVPGLKDQSLNRDSIYDRHGGDLQGVIKHLDYLQNLGVTTLWMTPVILNDMPSRTENGYAFTDHYRIDPRLGGEKAYSALSDSLHARGMKLIQDAVYNHIGSQHFLMQDSPSKDWVHQFPEFTQTSFKDQPLFDPYAAPSEKNIVTHGWFVKQMPDLNQENPFVANFLIQHALWSVETFGVDGWRIDTYIYNNLDFMNRCNRALTDEYPRMTMFGECWVHGTANQAYFAENNIQTPFKSNLQGVVDFQTLLYGIQPALKEEFGWTGGVNKLYNTLSNDFLYKDPQRNVIFLDNHDMTRIFSELGENPKKAKMAIAWLLTCRGIPQLYYGTEILMKGVSNPDGWVRLDFPGGWESDKKSAFTGQNLTNDEQDMLALTRKLGLFRKTSSALQTGKMMQYYPRNGLYTYFRYDGKQTVMCIMNTSKESQNVSLKDYPEFGQKHFQKAWNVTSQQEISLSDLSKIPAMTLWVLELK